jgi:proteasome lid subunit RPN8/RPN11
MIIHVPRALLRRIQVHAQQSYPHECCGLLLGKLGAAGARTVHDVQAVCNSAAHAAARYRIEPADYLRVDRQARAQGLDILGCYHSHPDGTANPSATDLACAWPWYVYLIVPVQAGQAADVRGWMLHDTADAPSFDPVDLAAR